MNVVPLPVLWVELAIIVAIIGAICGSQVREPISAWRWGLFFTGAALGCAVLGCTGFYLCRAADITDTWSLQQHFFGREILGMDELSAPLIPLVALLHFLTALATGRTKMRRFSSSWSLASEAIRLATFACTNPATLVGLLVAGTIPAYVELVNRGKSTRIYILHMGLFASLLIVGWIGVANGSGDKLLTDWATVPLLAAILIRCGTVPVHCWITDWFEHASLGNALLFVAPLTGVYAAIRLVLPVAPDGVLQGIGVFSLVTAIHAGGMALIQTDARRFFAFLFISHASLVLLGLELHTATSLTGALALWISAALSLTGLGLTLRALEARFGRLTLTRFRGLYEHSPALGVCFIVTGLACIGFPGTLGFVATELLVEGATQANLVVGVLLTVATAINGIAVVRAYFRLFTGARHVSNVILGITPRERLAVLTLMLLILGGGLCPQPGIASRYDAAMTVLHLRESQFGTRAHRADHRGSSGRGMSPSPSSTSTRLGHVQETPVFQVGPSSQRGYFDE
jgi:NADH-quinone oxidoreductase subunit M